MNKKILVTCPPMLAHMPKLEAEFRSRHWHPTTPEIIQTLDVNRLCELVPQHDGWIVGDDPANATVVGAAVKGRLKAAVKWGAGTDNIDFKAFAAANIPVSNTPGMFNDEVADVALGYLIGLARHTFEIHSEVVGGKWPKPSGISLKGRTIGLVGFGNIGKALHKRLLVCGMDVIVYDPYMAPDDLVDTESTKRYEWPVGLGECDFLCFTCALTAHNRHMLNADTIRLCKPGVRIVNVARGPLIDEAVLEAAIKSGQVASVALDVFEVEPLSSSSPLRRYQQNVFGSHNASNTSDAVLRTSLTAIALLEEHLC